MTLKPDLNWLSNPEVFAVNRLPAVSDHVAYPSAEAAEAARGTAFRQSLNGKWAFHMAENLNGRPDGFFARHFEARDWDAIEVPGYMQLQGYGSNQYVNTQYPWDGVEELRPPQVPEANLVGSYIRDFSFDGKAEMAALS